MNKNIFRLLTILGLLVLLSACGETDLTIDDAVNSFNEAGLEVEDVMEITEDDLGFAPMKADEAVRFLIPSLGEVWGQNFFLQ